MDIENKHIDEPARNHRHQMITRVYLPIAVVGLFSFGAGLFISFFQSAEMTSTSTWASIGLILLIIPPAIFGVAVLVALLLAVVGMGKVNNSLPQHFRTFRIQALSFNSKTQKLTNKLASPVIKVRSANSAFNALLKILRLFK
jgi:hypothetical protein